MTRELTWREALLAAGAGVVLAVLMSWPLPLHLGSEIGKDLGDPLLQAWQVAWIGHALLTSPLDLWQANTFWPYDDTLAFSDALVGYAPAGLSRKRARTRRSSATTSSSCSPTRSPSSARTSLPRELGVGLDRSRGGRGGIRVRAVEARAERPSPRHLERRHPACALPPRPWLPARERSTVVAGWLVAAWQMTLGFTLGLQLAYLLLVLVRSPASLFSDGAGSQTRSAACSSRPRSDVAFRRLPRASWRGPYLRVVDAHPEAKRTPAYVDDFSPRRGASSPRREESWLWATRRRAYATMLVRTRTRWSLFPGLAISVFGCSWVLWDRCSRDGSGSGSSSAVVTCALLSLGVRDVERARRLPRRTSSSSTSRPDGTAFARPDRINTLTSLGLALLAGAGVCALVRAAQARHARRRAALGASSVAPILVEGLGPLDAHPRCRRRPSQFRWSRRPSSISPQDSCTTRVQLLVDGRVPEDRQRLLAASIPSPYDRLRTRWRLPGRAVGRGFACARCPNR